MIVTAYDIEYDITDEDIETSFDAYLEIADLVEASPDLENITIDSHIYDCFQTDYPILIGFADGPDRMAYLYSLDAEDDECIFAHKVDTFTYEELAEDIKESLGDGMRIELAKEEIADLSETELEDYICDIISNETDYLIQGFNYKIED